LSLQTEPQRLAFVILNVLVKDLVSGSKPDPSRSTAQDDNALTGNLAGAESPQDVKEISNSQE